MHACMKKQASKKQKAWMEEAKRFGEKASEVRQEAVQKAGRCKKAEGEGVQEGGRWQRAVPINPNPNLSHPPKMPSILESWNKFV